MTFDFRTDQTPVRDQGNRPTCAVFATTAAHEWMSGDQPELSEEWALWVTKQRDGIQGEATTVDASLQGLVAEGHVTNELWPYGIPAYPAEPPDAAIHAEDRRYPGVWARLPSAALTNVGSALAEGDSVILSVRFVPIVWFAASDDGWIEAPPGSVVVDGHAVLAVGTIDDNDRGEAIVVKNSWGRLWGEDGYGFLSGSYLDDFGICAHRLARRAVA